MENPKCEPHIVDLQCEIVEQVDGASLSAAPAPNYNPPQHGKPEVGTTHPWPSMWDNMTGGERGRSLPIRLYTFEQQEDGSTKKYQWIYR